MTEQRIYWFRAKRYGWGWGLPLTWQGWVVLVAYTTALISSVFVFDPRTDAVRFIACSALLSLVLVMVCWRTGEPPRWRWGSEA